MYIHIITYFFVSRKKSALEKQQERDAAYEGRRTLRAKGASQQVDDDVADQHNEAFRFLSLIYIYMILYICFIIFLYREEPKEDIDKEIDDDVVDQHNEAFRYLSLIYK